jgi:hypothetical protein
MDLRAYYKSIREAEANIPTPFVVIKSRGTSDGGKAGVMTEVPRATAAKQLVEGKAYIASANEAEAFHRKNKQSKDLIDQEAAVSKMQFVVVPAKSETKGSKD